jgi:small subunit ribosomal protein S1
MVSKPTIIRKPGPVDESWWAAILSDEEKYAPPVTNPHSSKETITDKEAVQNRHGQKVTPVDWTRAEALFEDDEPVSLQVTGYNRGGLLVGGEGLHGFVPVSHLVDFDCLIEENEREDILEGYVGKEISLKVIECDSERGRVVFSERAALAVSGRRNQLFVTLKPGDRICGTVTNITEFGVFVDLGGIEGLIHVSELSWGRVRHPGDVVKVGDQVGAYVIQVDRNKSRIALSLKRLNPNPWETAEARYRPGDVVEARVTSVVPFGAFARLEEGLDGLIHSTEFGVDEAGNCLSQNCQEGQTILVRVINVDASRQRLGLSLKIDDW